MIFSNFRLKTIAIVSIFFVGFFLLGKDYLISADTRVPIEQKELRTNTEDQNPNVKVQVASVEAKDKKKKGTFFIVGGIVVAAAIGTAVYMLTRSSDGSIQVSSTPSGASVFLNNNSTGQVTPCTLENLEPGTHSLSLTLDGYLDHQEDVVVVKRETATVNVNLTGHNITISSPNTGSVWVKGRDYDIAWSTDGTVVGQAEISGSSFNGSNFILQDPSNAVQGSHNRRILRENNGRKSANLSADSMRSQRVQGQNVFIRNSRRANVVQPLNNFAGRNPYSQFTQNNDPVREQKSIANMSVDLYRGASLVRQITGSVPNNGSYTWTVPSDLADANDYLLRLSCSTDDSIFGQSAQFFLTDIGILKCYSVPTGANIFMDNVNLERQTNRTLNDIPVGNRVVKYTKDRFKNYSTTVNVQKNQTHNVNKTLVPDSFFENFDDNEAEYWNSIDGAATWTAEDKVFRARGDQYGDNLSHYKAGTAKFPANFTYEAKCRISMGETWHVYGLTIGTTNHETFLVFDVLGSGSYSVWEVSNFSTETNIIGWTPHSSINTDGTANILKVVRNGQTLTFFVNGTEVDSLANITLPALCEIGLWTWTYGYGIDETEFDDVRLTINSAAPSSIMANEGISSLPILRNRSQPGAHPAFPPGMIKK